MGILPAPNVNALMRRDDYPIEILDSYGKKRTEDANFLLGHQRTFAAVYQTFSKQYFYRFDEARIHSEENSKAMRNDAFICALLQERYVQLTSLNWHLEAEDARSNIQAEVTGKLTNIIRATDRWVNLVWTLADAIWYGRMASELRWEAQPVNGENRLCIVDHRPILGDKIQFQYDGRPAIQVHSSAFAELEKKGIVKKEDELYGNLAPTLVLTDPRWRDRFIFHRHLSEDNDYFEGMKAGAVQGIGLRSKLYWAWWLRDEILGMALNHLQKISMGGILVVYYDDGDAASQLAAEQAAMNAGERYAIAMPRTKGSSKDSNGMEFLAFNEAGVKSMTEVISSYFESHIERLVIGQTLSANTEGSGLGGSGVARLHEATKLKLLRFDAQNMADTLSNDLVMVAQKWNFPNANFRTRFVFDIPDPDAAAKLEAAMKFIQIGGVAKAEDVRRFAELAKPEKDDEVLSQELVQRKQMGIQIEGQLLLAKGTMALQQQAVLEQQAQQAQQMQALGASPQAAAPGQSAAPAAAQQSAPAEAPAEQEQAAAPAEQSATPEQGGGEATAAEVENKLLDIVAGDTDPELPNIDLGEEPVMAMEDGKLVRYESTHAPKGGVQIRGEFYPGGRFIPGAVLAAASPEEKAELAAKKAESGEEVPQMPAAGQDQQQVAASDEEQPQPQPQEQQVAQVVQKIQALPAVPEDEYPALQETLWKGTKNQRGVDPEQQEVVWAKMLELSQIPREQFAKVAGQLYYKATRADRTEDDKINAKAAGLVQGYMHQRGKMVREQASTHGLPAVIDREVQSAQKYIKGRGLKIATQPKFVKRQFNDDLINRGIASVSAPWVGLDPDTLKQRARDADQASRVAGRRDRDQFLANPNVQSALMAAKGPNATPQDKYRAEDVLREADNVYDDTREFEKRERLGSLEHKQKVHLASSLATADLIKHILKWGIDIAGPIVGDYVKRKVSGRHAHTYAADDGVVEYSAADVSDEIILELTFLLRDRIKNRVRRQQIGISEIELEQMATEQAKIFAPMLATVILQVAAGQAPTAALEAGISEGQQAADSQNQPQGPPTGEQMQEAEQQQLEQTRVYFDDNGAMVVEYASQASPNTHIDWTPDGGNRVLDIGRLLEMVKSRQPYTISLESVRPDLINRSPDAGFSQGKYKNCNVEVPALIDSHGRLIDGRHRAAKLFDMGADSMPAHVINEAELKKATVRANPPMEGLHKKFAGYEGTPMSGYGGEDDGDSQPKLPEGHVISPEGETAAN
jgi:phage gp29-like protein